ncbi:MAG TPA: HAF repeat-containing protein, partial [Blastocatellia bacterium]|nr:HAF repeat-containing protein [Blastocatellia bacterium]
MSKQLTAVNLGTLPGRRFSIAKDISNRGQIVGSGTFNAGEEDDHALLWEDGRIIDLGTLGGGRSFAEAINERGQIVGDSRTA